MFEHLEEDLAGYLNRMGDRGMAPKTIQVTNSAFHLQQMTGKHEPKSWLHFFFFDPEK